MTRPLILIAAMLCTFLAPRAESEASAPALAARMRVACIGASITFGAGVSDREKNAYPAQMQNLLGDGFEVRNYGVSGCTLLKHGDCPYWNEDACRQARAFDPAIVVIDLGGNDSKPQNWKFKNEFAADARALIESFRALPSRPRVLLCLPMPAFKVMWGIDDNIITREQIPILRQVAFDTGTELVDLHTAFLDKEAWFADSIHPGVEGAALMAKIIARVIAFKSDTGFNFEKALGGLGITPKVSSFYGYRQLDFTMEDGRQCAVVCPYASARERPIAWRGEYFGHEPQTDLALLQYGYHVVYVDTQNMFGSPPAMEIWEKMRGLLCRAGLDGKLTLIGMSIGGLYSYNWAIRHPETVAVIYGDAPVCNFMSWPGRPDQHRATKANWGVLVKLYGFKDEADALTYRCNPLENLEILAKAGVAIIHVVGQSDTSIPVQEHTDLVEKRYQALGGTIEVIRKPGCGHYPHSLPNPEPIVDFILRHAKK